VGALDAFKLVLGEHGYIEGRNIVIEIRSAEGRVRIGSPQCRCVRGDRQQSSRGRPGGSSEDPHRHDARRGTSSPWARQESCQAGRQHHGDRDRGRPGDLWQEPRVAEGGPSREGAHRGSLQYHVFRQRTLVEGH